jgi:RNA polymerase subunit RPABC4/transcription elongation factor Spt4
VEIIAILLLFWLIPSIIAAVVASRKGRSGFGFFVLSALLSPIVGLIAAIVARPNTGRLERQQIRSGMSKRCPYCSEVIRAEATVCKHCGREQFTRSCATANQSLAVPAPVSSAPPSVRFCTKCGSPAEHSAKFCPKCGRAMQLETVSEAAALAAPLPRSSTAESKLAWGGNRKWRGIWLTIPVLVIYAVYAYHASKSPSPTPSHSPTPSRLSEERSLEVQAQQLPGWLKQDLASIADESTKRVATLQLCNKAATGVDIKPDTALGLAHDNLVSLRSTVQRALNNASENTLPAWLRKSIPTYREGLLDIGNGTNMQLSFWDSGDTSVIERGGEKINVGIGKLTKFAEGLSQK